MSRTTCPSKHLKQASFFVRATPGHGGVSSVYIPDQFKSTTTKEQEPMNMSCQRCGGPIGRQTGSGGRRKFCTTCSPKRVRNKGGGQRQQSRPAVTAQPSEISNAGVANVYDATLAEVKALGMTDHYLGALALHVARMLDDSANVSGSAVASLAKCHRETVNEMRAAAPKTAEESPLERLRRERRERRVRDDWRL